MGPSGTSKTISIKDLCQTYPEGVLYHEINELNAFVQALAEEVGMKIKPTSVFECFSDEYCHYHRIPKYQLEGIAFVINTLATAAKKYKSRHGRVPGWH